MRKMGIVGLSKCILCCSNVDGGLQCELNVMIGLNHVADVNVLVQEMCMLSSTLLLQMRLAGDFG